MSEYLKNHLPNRRNPIVFQLVGIVADLLAVAGVVGAFMLEGFESYRSSLLTLFMIALVVWLIVRVTFLQRLCRKRLDLTVYFLHHFNHLARNSVADPLSHMGSQPIETISNLLDTVSGAFTNACGRRCRAALVELSITNDAEAKLKTVARDRKSDQEWRKANVQDVEHDLHETTSFTKLWYGATGAQRYYLCNDLPSAWLEDRYDNPALRISPPETAHRLGLVWLPKKVTKWPLRYKSTMVFPVRYVSKWSPPPKRADDTAPLHIPESWKVWGFLCVDCNTTGVFDDTFFLELGGAFSDGMYVFLENLRDRVTEKA